MTTTNRRQLSDANTDGTVLGQSPTDKIAFYGATPVTRQTGVGTTTLTAVTTAASTTITLAAGYATTTQADDIVARLNSLLAWRAEVNTMLTTYGLKP